VLSCVLSGHRRNWPAAAGKPGSQKNYAAGLEIRCPGGVYFNRDNSQLAPIYLAPCQADVAWITAKAS
jgi:hypothetical protein